MESRPSVQYPSKVPSVELFQQKSSKVQTDQSTSSNPSSFLNCNHLEEIDAKTVEFISYILNHLVSCILNPSSYIKYNHLECPFLILYPESIIIVHKNIIPNKF